MKPRQPIKHIYPPDRSREAVYPATSQGLLGTGASGSTGRHMALKMINVTINVKLLRDLSARLNRAMKSKHFRAAVNRELNRLLLTSLPYYGTMPESVRNEFEKADRAWRLCSHPSTHTCVEEVAIGRLRANGEPTKSKIRQRCVDCGKTRDGRLDPPFRLHVDAFLPFKDRRGKWRR